MKALTKGMNTVSKSELRDKLEEVLAQVQTGEKILITDNGQSLAEMIPVAYAQRENTKRAAKLLTTKEEFLAEIADLEAAYLAGAISPEDCYLSRFEPIDMGPTNSSNLDREIYK